MSNIYIYIIVYFSSKQERKKDLSNLCKNDTLRYYNFIQLRYWNLSHNGFVLIFNEILSTLRDSPLSSVFPYPLF